MSRTIELKSTFLRHLRDNRRQDPQTNEREERLWRQFAQAWNCRPLAVGGQIYYAVKKGI